MFLSWAELHKKTRPVARSCATTLEKSYGIFAPWNSLLDGGRDIYMPLPYLLNFTGKDSACGILTPLYSGCVIYLLWVATGEAISRWRQNFPGSGLI